MIELNVGIISQTLVQQHHLRHVVEESGYHIGAAWLINQVLDNLNLLENAQDIDVWLVDVDTVSFAQQQNLPEFEAWLFTTDIPVIFGEGNTYNAVDEGFNSWVRQLTSKLTSISGQLSLDRQQQRPADSVWVLAASTGGPEVVKQFLDVLPPNLGVAFLYAQHIESQQNRALATSVTRNSHYPGKLAQHGERLSANTVTVVPADQELDILMDGTLVIRSGTWRGQYRPSIDKVVATVADRFGPLGGAIFFSGMGDDGVVGARLMSRRGGQVWIQSPPSCASDSMPVEVNKTGCVTTIGTPKQLGLHLQKAIAKTVGASASTPAQSDDPPRVLSKNY